MKKSLLIAFALLTGVASLLAQTADTSSGKTHFIVQGVAFDFAFVQGGTFTMGCTDEQNKCEEDEKPAHDVTLSSYYIGTTEVTIGQYLLFCNETNSHYPEWLEKNNRFNIYTGTDIYYKNADMSEQNTNNPVTGVSWYDAKAYCEWLSKKMSKPYRLPTEAEWEYAARGGNKSQHTQYSGSNTLDEVAWYIRNSGDKTHPVAQKKANELGLYDMSGNAWEWCSDWYGNDYYTNSPSSNPKGVATGWRRVLHSGSWGNNDLYCGVAYRCNFTSDYHTPTGGFRLVASAQ